MEQFAAADILGISALFIFVLDGTKKLSLSAGLKLAVYGGFVLRVALALWGTFADGEFADFLRRGDQKYFWEIALRYFHGDYRKSWTNYPYVLNAISHIFGPCVLASKLVNILAWFAGLLLIMKRLDYRKTDRSIQGKSAIFCLLAYLFLPWQVLLSVTLFRESLISIWLMASFLYLWKWMEQGKTSAICLSVIFCLPAIWLHTGNVSMWFAIFIVYIAWDVHHHRWKWLSSKMALLFAGILLAVPLYQKVFVKAFPGYLPTELSLEALSRISPQYDSGRTEYIAPVLMTGIGQFLMLLVRHSIYFWISPAPWLWNSWMDAAGFFGDTFLWCCLFALFGKMYRRKRLDVKAASGVIVILVFTIVYGMGTFNAGTAMRHRDQLLGVLIMALLWGMKVPSKGV